MLRTAEQAGTSGDRAGKSTAAEAAGGGRATASLRSLAEGGLAAQEAAMAPTPEGAPRAEDERLPLDKRRAADALTYNKARERTHGAAWITAMQASAGAPVSGTWDETSVQALGRLQQTVGATVDGKVGPETRRKLEGVVVAKPTKPEGPTEQGAAGDVTAAVPAADASEKAPRGGERSPDEAADLPPDVRRLRLELETILLPILRTSEGSLDLAPYARSLAQSSEVLQRGVKALAALPAGSLDHARLTGAVSVATQYILSSVGRVGPLVRDEAVRLVNDASLMKAGVKQPNLPSQADATTYQAALRLLQRLAGDTALGPAAAELAAAATAAQDGALAVCQGLSVLSARATWKKGVEEPDGKDVKSTKGQEINEIFKDSGWSEKGALTKAQSKDGTELDKLSDWCGMFVGASMFRGGGPRGLLPHRQCERLFPIPARPQSEARAGLHLGGRCVARGEDLSREPRGAAHVDRSRSGRSRTREAGPRRHPPWRRGAHRPQRRQRALAHHHGRVLRRRDPDARDD
jgi:hypothetical protein